MPSASAKVEKVASFEASDPVKQIAMMLEKRIRNLEKRKMKLDNYRSDVQNGKELNEDQKMAVSKYDEVVVLLDFTKELIKGLNSIVLESSRQQKKIAKKEQIERQQHEVQRLQEAFFYRHTLARFQNEEVRNDFLNGENGAVQLTTEQLSQLDQMFKLIGHGLPNEQEDLNNYCHALAENHIFLVEGKNKEVAGTTYKVLKDILLSINACGYFSRPSETVDDDEASSDETPEEEVVEKQDLKHEESPAEDDAENSPDFSQEQFETSDEEKIIPHPVSVHEDTPEVLPTVQSRPLQEVLSPQGSFNFLQESQIDLDAPHMDPAVVAVHQIAPPPAVNFTYPPSPPCEEVPKPLVNGSEPHELPPPSLNQVPVLPIRPHTPPMLSGSQSDFDPSHPIPTQTFTNQSFAVIQNMMIPPAYVPVTVHHTGSIPPHIAPIAVVPGAVVPGLSPPASTTCASVLPLHVPVTPIPVSTAPEDDVAINVEQKSSDNEENQVQSVEENDAGDGDVSTNGVVNDKNNGTNGFVPSYRGGGYRGRGRGRGSGYFRGRPNYNNNRGGYQNYYQDRNGYYSNFRRGSNNRGPRPNGNRIRGNYRTQTSQQQQQQQQQTQQ